MTARRWQYHTDQQIKTMVFNQIMDLSRDFHDGKNVGALGKLTLHGTAIGNLGSLVTLDLIPVVMDLSVSVSLLYLRFGPYMGMISAASILLYSWWWFKKIAKPQEASLREYFQASRHHHAVFYESIENWLTAIYFHRVEYEKSRYLRAVQELLQSAGQYRTWVDIRCVVAALILNTGYAGACFMLVLQIIQGPNSAGNFIMFTTYWNKIAETLQRLDKTVNEIIQQFQSGQELVSLLKRLPLIRDGPDAVSLSAEFAGDVQFESVSFAYPRNVSNVLEEVSFTCLNGQITAIVGETGAGKSTIFKLLLRHVDPSKGSVKINGHDIRNVERASLQEIIGIVPQDVTFFNESIRYNLEYAKSDASMAEIIQACKAARVHEWIEKLPNGYDTNVGDKGVKLSVGERQRLSIAQNILKNPTILLLDEPTSAIDVENERHIQKNLEQSKDRRTTIVITHRLTTICAADNILVLKGGKIVDQGAHKELMTRPGYYRDVLHREHVKDQVEAQF
uniref:Heavy metal tolerance protein n=1 Tax=Talaromyces marneffei PM1 TaxID=1077442 RepID=A0A093UQI9_TALMA